MREGKRGKGTDRGPLLFMDPIDRPLMCSAKSSLMWVVGSIDNAVRTRGAEIK